MPDGGMVPAPLAVTMGEPAGIGGEIAFKAWLGRHDAPVPPFFLIDDPDRLAGLARHLQWSVPIRAIDRAADAAPVFEEALPVLPEALPGEAAIGTPDPANAPAVMASIERAVGLVSRGEASAVVTNPIQKSTLYQAGFRFPGHTEYLAELAKPGADAEAAAADGHGGPVMMLSTPDLRVVPVTVHLSLADAIRALTTEAICHAAEVTVRALRRDLGVGTPRLTVAALNPHAGEGGAMGREEIDVIIPAVERLKALGLAVDGPLPADTLFHERARTTYDAALCMYHDQALIPLKTIDFDRGVNVTLGLPIVRTSPDHGTALAIAGKGIANQASFAEALRLADRMARTRAMNPAE
jgi:4-hydroxythreonine-4-phosphate dehydrogenase